MNLEQENAKEKRAMTPLEEARELERRIRRAIFEMGGVTGADGFEEGEVRFRIESIVGMLLMAKNDTQTLVKEWTGLVVLEKARAAVAEAEA